jgi:hypothetical protein
MIGVGSRQWSLCRVRGQAYSSNAGHHNHNGPNQQCVSIAFLRNQGLDPQPVHWQLPTVESS